MPVARYKLYPFSRCQPPPSALWLLLWGTFIFGSINPLNKKKKQFNPVIWSITYAFSGLSKYLILLLKDLNYEIPVLGFLPNRTKIELQLHNKQELLIANFVEFLPKRKEKKGISLQIVFWWNFLLSIHLVSDNSGQFLCTCAFEFCLCFGRWVSRV